MALHETQHFAACRDCGELHPMLDSSVAFLDDAGIEGADAYTEFLTRHRAHHIASLWRSGWEVRADRPLWDPLATLTFEVTDGDQSYVVNATRRSIEDERVYRFAPGVLEVGNAEVQIDPYDLRRGLDLQFGPQRLSRVRTDRFLAAVHEVVNQIDADDLEIAFDDADDPAVSIACIPDATYDDLLARCAKIFDPREELPRVLAFLRDNRGADGLLALRVRRRLAALSA
jgi:hypothetical protein